MTKTNPYKQHLGLTLTEIGSLLGLSKEAIRVRLARTNHYKSQIWDQRQEIERLKDQIHTLHSQIQRQQGEQLSLFPEQREQGFDYIKDRSLRTQRLVERMGFRSLQDIQQYGLQRLAREPNIGRTSLQIIEEGLRMGGLDPRETVLTHSD